jgi:hypothetical protein
MRILRVNIPSSQTTHIAQAARKGPGKTVRLEEE